MRPGVQVMCLLGAPKSSQHRDRGLGREEVPRGAPQVWAGPILSVDLERTWLSPESRALLPWQRGP